MRREVCREPQQQQQHNIHSSIQGHSRGVSIRGNRAAEEQTVAEGLDIISPGRRSVKVGMPWSVTRFTELALQVEHPFLSARGDCDDLKDKLDAVFSILTRGPTAIKESRKQLIERLRKRKVDLSASQQEYYDNMHEDVRNRMGSKPTLLLQ